MGCMFLAGVVKQCLLFCETSLTSSILCEAGKEGRACKGQAQEQSPSCCSPRAQAVHVCAGEVLLNVPLAAGWWEGRADEAELSLPKDPVVHIGRKFYLPKWLATGKVSTSSSEVFLTHISSWEFLVLTKLQYAACLICCFIYQGKETTV